MSRFPLFRLGTLLARQLSAPIATRIKVVARSHPRFGRWVCMRTGRAFREAELRFRMWTLALRQPRAVPPISDQTALDAGADILGEIVIFALGGLIVTLEVNRQANNQEEKELDEQSQWLAMMLGLEELRRELELQQQDMDRLHGVLRRLASQYDPQAAPIPAPLVPTPAPPPPTLGPQAPIGAPSPKKLPTCMEPLSPATRGPPTCEEHSSSPTCEEPSPPLTCEEPPSPPKCEELPPPPTSEEPPPSSTCEEPPPPTTCVEPPPPPTRVSPTSPASPPSPPPCPEPPPPLSEPPCQCQQLVKPKC